MNVKTAAIREYFRRAKKGWVVLHNLAPVEIFSLRLKVRKSGRVC